MSGMNTKTLHGILSIFVFMVMLGVTFAGPVHAEGPAEAGSDAAGIEARYATAEALRQGTGGVIDLRSALEIYTELAALGH